MVSVTQRIRQVTQPRGGYINPRAMEIRYLNGDAPAPLDHRAESVDVSVVGSAVEYLARIVTGTPVKEAFLREGIAATRAGSEAFTEMESLIEGAAWDVSMDFDEEDEARVVVSDVLIRSTCRIVSLNYAVAFADLYLPHLRKTLRSSVAKGDLLDDNMPIWDLDRRLVRARNEPMNWRTMYAVYFSNLKQTDVDTLHRELSKDERYRGYIDVSLANPVRDYLARCLPSTWVLHDKKVLLTHGADEPFVQDLDPVGFDLPSYGYEVVSLLDSYFYCFLSYKIESESSNRAEEDRILTLAAHVGAVIDVETVDIVVPAAKLERYLLVDENKLRLMTNIGLQDVTPDDLAGIIRQKLLGSYVYDFRIANGDTPTFAVVCEFGAPDGRTLRRLLALKYDAQSNAISLVSMY